MARGGPVQVPAADVGEFAVLREHSDVGADVAGGGAEGAEVGVAAYEAVLEWLVDGH